MSNFQPTEYAPEVRTFRDQTADLVTRFETVYRQYQRFYIRDQVFTLLKDPGFNPSNVNAMSGDKESARKYIVFDVQKRFTDMNENRIYEIIAEALADYEALKTADQTRIEPRH